MSQQDYAAEIKSIAESIKKLNERLDKLMQSSSPAKVYDETPGIEGTFDGVFMNTTTGERFEVPANYAAKSELVYGDTLKMIEEDGKQLYKQVIKVPRKELPAVATKKEGMWYVITDKSTYKISDVAAEFYKVQLGQRVVIKIPQLQPNTPFATLKRIKFEEIEALGLATKQPVGLLKAKEEKSVALPKLQPQSRPSYSKTPAPVSRPVKREVEPQQSNVAPMQPQNQTSTKVEEDDLV